MNRTTTVIGRELAGAWRRLSHNRGPARRRALAVTSVTATLTLLVTLVSPVGSAQALDYPTWQDLQNAKSNTVAAAEQVTRIQELLVGLQTQVEQTQAEADARAAALEEAQQKFDDAARRASDLQEQADASKATADAATRQAGQLAAQLYRTGGTDLSVNLFIEGSSGGEADALLSKLGNMSKLVERSTDIYDVAQSANNSAQALGDQARIAQTERETLRVAAEAALKAAQSAAEVAAAALVESQEKSVELDSQLAFMRDAEATTSAGYEAGVVERARLEAIRVAEVARQAAAARAAAQAAAAAAAAARAPASSGSSGGTSSSVSSTGWGVPASGRITGGYGSRTSLCSSGGGYCSGTFHYGTDLGTGCYAPIYAAKSGTVTWAGRLGTYGNFVKIDHGDGVSTGYAHIRDGGIFVQAGQRVSVGQNIASSGETGASTACHLHFEVWINGNRINAAPFMADRGAPLG
ncbi:M23 family metallopeptidase [Cryobacterium psychrophilum]|uniref:M23 family metallopeptidase n=2 Tax=Cryobacterium psychrophilum TaxID=41988 RepID=A0A4Y8KN40_9MICO|nr:M23 family metallopeptidase [Cryobacterium psychrophilum]